MIRKYNVFVKKTVTGHAVFFSGDWLIIFLLFFDIFPQETSPAVGHHTKRYTCMDEDVIDLSDEQTYKETMRKLDKESVCPCAECVKRLTCETPHYCIDYKRWRKLYMQRRYG